jgi:polyhydroxybutyrate depolymerase
VKRGLVLAAAFLVTLGVAVLAGVRIMSAVDRPSTTTSTNSIKVGSLTRQYEVIAATSLPSSAPILVVLSGAAATTGDEITRDRLMPYATTGKAELVYPTAIEESWNAIGCCDGAAKLNIDDVGFIKALVPAIDPGRARLVYIVGYSVGGRLAYRLACTDPTLADGMVAVKADPMPGCVVTRPMNVMVFASMDDKYVPYKPGEKGLETPAATVQIARLQTNLKCSSKPTVVKHGTMTLSSWSCADGKTLQWALYQSGGHDFPAPDGDTAGANQLIWSFVSKAPLEPVPR